MSNPTRLPCAVLTGDLVNSQTHPQAAISKALDVIKAIAAADCNRSRDPDPKFTRFRGDGWQFILGDVPRALRVAVQIHASLKADPDLPATRVSIGVGTIDSPGGQTLADASGAAFVTSGQALDWLERKGGHLAISGSGITCLHQIAVELLELRVTLWTPPQAQAAALFLQTTRTTGRDIAEKLGISQQAVSYRLAGADARRIGDLLDQWETEFAPTSGGSDG